MTNIVQQGQDPEDEQYKSSEDEDFDPEAAARDIDDNVSSSEDDAELRTVSKAVSKRSKKRVTFDDELGSGDEETIQQLNRTRRSKRANSDDDDNDDEAGGPGGEIKTRAQRRAEKNERAEFCKTHGQIVTIDVNDLWVQLSSAPVGRRAPTAPELTLDEGPHAQNDEQPTAPATDTDATPEADLVTITRVREFAGETVTSEERVHKDSKEAKDFLAAQATKPAPARSSSSSSSTRKDHDGPPLRRPLARPSLYEPNPTGEVKGLPAHRQRLKAPSRADVLMQAKRLAAEHAEAEQEAKSKAQRLNTVQKSALDWDQHVDTEGLKDELSEYGRSKQGFMGKMDFLQGVSSRREDESKKARMQTAS